MPTKTKAKPKWTAAEASNVALSEEIADLIAEAVAGAVAPVAYSMPDAARALGVSTRALYYAAAAGDQRLTKVGRRTLITRAELEAFLDRASQRS